MKTASVNTTALLLFGAPVTRRRIPSWGSSMFEISSKMFLICCGEKSAYCKTVLCTPGAVWKVCGLGVVRRCYAGGRITAAHCRQSTNFSNGPRSCSAILKRLGGPQNGFGAHPASYPMGTRGSFPRVKQPGREADHSPPSNAVVKNEWSYTSIPPIRLHGVVLS
jgi:hypothetical protein